MRAEEEIERIITAFHPYAVFFQEEGGIRDGTVTGVQTCALPICVERERRLARSRRPSHHRDGAAWKVHADALQVVLAGVADADEVGHEFNLGLGARIGIGGYDRRFGSRSCGGGRGALSPP